MQKTVDLHAKIFNTTGIEIASWLLLNSTCHYALPSQRCTSEAGMMRN